MTGLGQGLLLFLLWMCLLPSGNCNFYADILWGQCYAFCLTRQGFRSQQKAGTGDVHPPKQVITIKHCRRDRICKTCLYVCGRPKHKYLSYESCMSDCEVVKVRRRTAEAKLACLEACDFIQQSSQSKYGSCPAPENMTGLTNMCTVQCQRDVECDRVDKCCGNGCAKVCHPPTDLDVFPPRPGALEFKVLRDGGVLIKWDERGSGDYVEPVVSVLRWWCPDIIGVRFSATTHSKLKVKGLRPASSCYFMVAATNIKGSLGFSEPHPYKKKLVKPSPPENLEVFKNKINGDKVDVTVRWEPPRFLDGLPLDQYLILWSDGLPEVSPDYHRLRMNKKFVNSERMSATIPRLKSGTTYFVQVKAVVKWKGRLLNGIPISIYTKTISPPRPAGLDNGGSNPETIVSTSNIYNVTVHEAAFVQGQLTTKVTWSVLPDSNVEKYMIYWTANTCDGEAQHRKTQERSMMEATTHKQEFYLYNLKSNCLYEMSLYTVGFYEGKDAGHSHRFKVPPCYDLKGRNEENCPSKVDPPDPPTGLYIRYKSNCYCPAIVGWSWPDGAELPAKILVVWGPSRDLVDSRLSSIVYQKDPYKVHALGHEDDACITHLKPRKHYTVQVTSHIDDLKSRPAVLNFRTPYNLKICEKEERVDYVLDPHEEETTEGSQKAVRDPGSGSRGHHTFSRPDFLLFLLIATVVFLMNTMHIRT